MSEQAHSDGEQVLKGVDVVINRNEAAILQALPAHERKQIRYMKRLNKRHLLSWPSRASFPRYKHG